MLNKNLIIAAILLMLFLSFLNLSQTHSIFNKTTTASPDTILVPDNYPTIQEAINKAKNGDIILVRADTYYENLTINKAISVIGENKYNTIIDGNGSRAVVYITANNVTLKNFTIQNGQVGIWLFYSSNNTMTSNIVSHTTYGCSLTYSSNNAFTGNTVSDNEYGFFLSSSSNNFFAGNNLSANYRGVYLWRSNTNTFTSNTVSNNYYGFFVDDSSNNILTENTVQNNTYAIQLDGSNYNTVTHNNISSNNGDGIRLYHSSNNIFTSNTASNNQYGMYVSDSDNNILSGNTASNNQYGMSLYYSDNNIITANNFTKNTRYGIHLTSSNNNEIFQNNFIDNVEQARNINSVSSWDNNAEGNYWSNYRGVDVDKDGIGDTPHSIDTNNKDDCPLMANFLQLSIATQNQFYKIPIVSNSIISNFQYGYDPDTKTSAISFEAYGTETTGFCRIGVPHALIKPPYALTTSNNPPLNFKKLYSNETHTWLYFAYYHPQQEITLTHVPYPEQLLQAQWAIIGLTITIIILLVITVNYHRKLSAQKKIMHVYERELGSLPPSHPERARARFIRDVIKREEKIERFKKKYGVKIQPAPTPDDLMEKLGVQKRSKKKVKH